MAEARAKVDSRIVGAPLLDYNTPAQDVQWMIRVEADHIDLTVKGPPAWWQFTRAITGIVVCGPAAVAAAVLVLASVVRGRTLGSESVAVVSFAVILGWLAASYTARLRRLVRFGPDSDAYRLTSRYLKPQGDRIGPEDDLALVVDDVVAGPGVLLYNGRGETVLRFILPEGSIFPIRWRGTREEAERAAEDLRRALGLATEMSVLPSRGE